MSLKIKIIGGFMVIVLLGTILGIVGVTSIQKLTSMSQNLLQMENDAKDFSNILSAHYDWRGNMSTYIITKEEFTGSVDPNGCAMGKWLSENEDAVLLPEVRYYLDSLIPPHNEIHHGAATIIDLINSGKDLEAEEMFLTDILPNANEVINDLKLIGELYSAMIYDQNDAIILEGSKAVTHIAIIIVTALVIAVALGIIIALSITAPLGHLCAFMKKAGTTGDISLSATDQKIIGKYALVKDEIGETIRSCSSFVGHVTMVSSILETISKGDLTAKIKKLSDNDVMGNSLSEVTRSLNKMFSEIKLTSAQVERDALRVQDNTQSISDSMSQIAGAAQLLAEGSTQQALSVQGLSDTVGAITSNTKSNTELAGKASLLADTVIANAHKGSQQMKDMITAVTEITIASRQIETIIETINDIASQTNLLSLNAAIEAARAGDHGRGFAVVASEVGKLAEGSTEAAAKTNIIIQTSIEKAELGARIVDETAKSLAEIISGIEESSQFIHEIAEASMKQLTDIQSINHNIQSVSDIVNQNSATAEESAAAAEESAAATIESNNAVKELSDISTKLNGLIAQFQIEKSSA